MANVEGATNGGSRRARTDRTGRPATTTQRLDYQGNPIPDNYKWIALSNTTLGVLIATINASILLISLPDIFKGIDINPLLPSNTNYLLWLILGFLVVTAVLVVSARPARRHLRARADVQPRLRRVHGVQRAAVGHVDEGQLRRAVADRRCARCRASAARCCSPTPARSSPTRSRQDQRGLALGINGVAAVAGSSIGLVLGGVLAPVAWRAVFLVSVPFGIFGTVWGY